MRQRQTQTRTEPDTQTRNNRDRAMQGETKTDTHGHLSTERLRTRKRDADLAYRANDWARAEVSAEFRRNVPMLDALGTSGMVGVPVGMPMASWNVSLEGTSVDSMGPCAPAVEQFFQRGQQRYINRTTSGPSLWHLVQVEVLHVSVA